MGWRFWIDRGGTFTDVVAVRPDGSYFVQKLLSEAPERYADAALEAIARSGAAQDEIDEVKMGTTVATNALLERTGEPTCLVMTEGFEDLLRIGHQARPDIFALHIQRPTPLYASPVVGAAERVADDGRVLRPLDEVQLRQRLTTAHQSGLNSVAIVLLHAWRYPEHELRAAAIARDVGFAHVTTSHQTASLMKVVPRGDTTVVDAYLSPVLRRYVDRVATRLTGPRLLFMQSGGGLTPASEFRGKDAVLSGPAGGVVGAIAAGAEVGHERLIGFDMGGTSTDVCHYSGTLERTFEAEIAGARLISPMLAVHTVAAGGGSILHWAGLRYRVGPDSAGADPGPACYRRGGPLTITDCNVMLGRVVPQLFPSVFGPTGDQSIDVDGVRNQFEALAHAIGKSAAQVADDFLNVAVEQMARAIRHISVERGHNVMQYALCGFGGAAGQHVCRVADALQMSTIIIHQDAGVLSARGIGHAAERRIVQEGIEQPLTEDAVAHCLLRVQTLGRPDADVLGRVHVRYAGTDSGLEVALPSDATMDSVHAAFERTHRQRFGFVWPDRTAYVMSVVVESIVQPPPVKTRSVLPSVNGTPTRADVWFDGASRSVDVWSRQHLAANAIVEGPAIIVDDTGTTVLEPDWHATVHASGSLVLTRSTPRQRRIAAGTSVDPMLLTVFNHRFMSVAEQMGVTLERTAQSVNIKERRDYSCAVFDAAGRLVANAPHIPVHLGSMGAAVRSVLARANSVSDGDAFAINDPYAGGTHLPDITVVTPVFIDGALEAWVAARGHHADVGGSTPGSMPSDSTHIDEEGARIPLLHLVSQGRFQEAAARSALGNARNKDQNIADLQAQVAANARGAEQLRGLVAEFGRDTVQAYTQHVRANAAESVRQLLEHLPDGHARVLMDDGCAIEVRVSVDRAQRRATVDFAGTSEQQSGNANAPSAVCHAVVLYVFRTLTGQPIPLNSGCLEPLDIRIPAGCMLDPQPPAAVVAGNVETSQVIADALLLAVGALAGSQGTMNNLTFGDATHQYYETICGGAGAGPGFAGEDAVHTHMTNSRLTDPEVLEHRFPVIVERFGVRTGSGGAGQFSGGAGAIRVLRFEAPMTVSILSNRRTTCAPGLAGGDEGSPGRNRVRRADGTTESLSARARVEVRVGDQIHIETPGGGGYGSKV